VKRGPERRQSVLTRGIVAVVGGIGQDRVGYRVGGRKGAESGQGESSPE
jgi:hypothetical protein